MDPVSVIIAALTVGASSALKDTAASAIKDAYAGLKALIKRRLGDRPLAQDVIDKHEESPDVWEKPLEDELNKAGVADDVEIVKAAQVLLAQVDPDGTARGKYSVTISGGKGIVVGDHATVHQTFDDGD
jgi:hypothetical protein